ncbi:Tripartite motif containing 37 [Geranomyces variabilis]|nr:Tripartite motif containing 37 [Geranomyces variabilis]
MRRSPTHRSALFTRLHSRPRVGGGLSPERKTTPVRQSHHDRAEHHNRKDFGAGLKGKKDPAMSKVLNEMFKCFICFGEFNRPVMAPCCSTVGCEDCLKKWLAERSDCPHCRAYLPATDLVQCRFIDDLANQLKSVMSEKTVSEARKKAPVASCAEHSAPFLYYCHDCDKAVCPDCAVIGNEHKGHGLGHLHSVFDHRKSLVTARMATARQILEQYEKKLALIKKTLDRLKSAKAKAEITLAVFYARCLDHVSKQTIEKVGALEEYQTQILNDQRKIIDVLQGLQDFDIGATPSGDVPHLDDCLDISTFSPDSLTQPAVSYEFDLDSVPAFDNSDWCIPGFRQVWEQQSVLRSPPLAVDGYVWRLRMSLSGDGSCISLFIEMLEGPSGIGPLEYDIRVTLRGAAEGGLLLTRECAARMKKGEAAGWNHFCPVDKKHTGGFSLDGCEPLRIRFGVRAVSYAQKCRTLSAHVKDVQVGRTPTLACDFRDVETRNPQQGPPLCPAGARDYWSGIFKESKELNSTSDNEGCSVNVGSAEQGLHKPRSSSPPRFPLSGGSPRSTSNTANESHLPPAELPAIQTLFAQSAEPPFDNDADCGTQSQSYLMNPHSLPEQLEAESGLDLADRERFARRAVAANDEFSQDGIWEQSCTDGGDLARLGFRLRGLTESFDSMDATTTPSHARNPVATTTAATLRGPASPRGRSQESQAGHARTLRRARAVEDPLDSDPPLENWSALSDMGPFYNQHSSPSSRPGHQARRQTQNRNTTKRTWLPPASEPLPSRRPVLAAQRLVSEVNDGRTLRSPFVRGVLPVPLNQPSARSSRPRSPISSGEDDADSLPDEDEVDAEYSAVDELFAAVERFGAPHHVDEEREDGQVCPGLSDIDTDTDYEDNFSFSSSEECRQKPTTFPSFSD